jgi:cytidylate kinase
MNDTPQTASHSRIMRQLQGWHDRIKEAPRRRLGREAVITVSMAPGSGGSKIAESVAQKLGYDYFHRDIIKEIANSAKLSTEVIDTLEKERLTGINDFIGMFVKKHYLHPDTYVMYLMKVVKTIAEHGHAVIVGRGANLILPVDKRISVRVIAPMDLRIQNVVKAFDCTEEEAKERIMTRQSRRKAFIHQAYPGDIGDPLGYDLVLHTGAMTIEAAVAAVVATVEASAVSD